MKRTALLIGSLLIINAAALAQWSNNPMVNTAVVTSENQQTTPSIATADNGDTYISWFSIESGNYNLRMQRYEVHGIRKWASEGLLVSNNQSMTWITDHSLATDKSGYALLSFMDIRNGYNNVYAYRISPSGQQAWGNNGIALSSGDYFEPYARIAVTSDNQAVFVWQRSYNTGNSKDALVLQKISPAGTKKWGTNGKVLSSPTLNYASPEVVVSDSNSVIIAWTKAGSGTTAPRYIYAQRMDSLGNTMWSADVPINTIAGLPMGTTFKLISDGMGGAFISWFDDRTMLHFRAFVQHVDKFGNLSMTQNGLNLSTNGSTQQLYPDIAWLPGVHRLFCFYQEEDLNQNNSGLFGQKVSLNGSVYWGNSGKNLIPYAGNNIQFISARAADSSVVVFYMDENVTGTSGTIWAMNLDSTGSYIWAGQKQALCSLTTPKSFLKVGHYNNEQWISCWEDHRASDPGDIYAQNLQIDGSLGPVTVGVNENPSEGFSLGTPYPNPTRQKTSISYTLGSAMHVNLSIFDLNGNLCKALADCGMQPGTYYTSWDGTNSSGLRVPPGVYLLKVSCGTAVETKKIVLL